MTKAQLQDELVRCRIAMLSAAVDLEVARSVDESFGPAEWWDKQKAATYRERAAAAIAALRAGLAERTGQEAA